MFSCFTGTWLTCNDLFCPPPHPKKRKKREILNGYIEYVHTS